MMKWDYKRGFCNILGFVKIQSIQGSSKLEQRKQPHVSFKMSGFFPDIHFDLGHVDQ